MPVKVFNETFGRDEEKVFGEDTNRSFGEIEVPSVPEFQELASHVAWLRRELDESRELLKVESKEREVLSARALNREQVDRVVAELKDAFADTSAFSNAMLAALHTHEKRVRSAAEEVRNEVKILLHQTQASASSAQNCLQEFRIESTAAGQNIGKSLMELKVLFEVTQKTQKAALLQAEEVAGLRRLEAWSESMNKGGFWIRLKWLFHGYADAELAQRNQ
jgi:hypothetical protein